MKYLCGCDVEAKANYRTEFDSEGRQIIPMRDGIRICPEHGEPIQGYRTALAIAKGILPSPPPMIHEEVGGSDE